MPAPDDDMPRRKKLDPAREGGDDASSEDPDDAEGSGDDESIVILDVTATDEAGVRLEDKEDEGEPEVNVTMDADIATDRADDVPTAATSAARPGGGGDASQAQELREQLLRTAADFENFRKRTERDRIEERKQATAGVVRNMLPVLDSFQRALEQARKVDDNPALASFVQGVLLIESQLFDILRAAGLEQVEATGAFDPSVHEALMQEPSTTVPHMDILAVFEPGYRLGGRLLRPARVKVASNPGGEAQATSDG